VGGYAFGDTAPAARRLGLLADVFEQTSRAFLTRVAGRSPRLAVDLGCGPGHTTRLLAAVLWPRRTIGLDQSASFVTLAAAGAPPEVEFAVHDVTVVPFPCRPADLVFCRFLLSHLADPPGLARRHDRAAPLAPPAARAAEMFGQNLAVWRDDAVRSGVATGADLDRLADDLATVAAGEVEGTIAWELRQLAYRRPTRPAPRR
jgi:trans-aconitate methyltransferase